MITPDLQDTSVKCAPKLGLGFIQPIISPYEIGRQKHRKLYLQDPTAGR